MAEGSEKKIEREEIEKEVKRSVSNLPESLILRQVLSEDE